MKQTLGQPQLRRRSILSLFRALGRYIRSVLTAPFRADPDTVLQRPQVERERARRAALLRLIVLSLTIIQFLALPNTLLNHAPPIVIETQVGVLALGCVSLLLYAVKHAALASFVYIYGAIALAIDNVVQDPGGLNIRSLLILGLLPAFILATGLLLPRWSIWLTAGLCIALCVACIAALPLSPAFSIGASSETVRGLADGLLATILALTAVLTWIFARSAQAGTEAVARAYEREHELAALKDQFLVNANHELRTPIMAWYGNVEFLLRLGDRATPEQRQRLLERSKRSGDTVLGLLASVLDASVLEARTPRLNLSAVALAPLVRNVLETFDPREIGEPGLEEAAYTTRAVTVDVPPTLVAWADEGKLRQILLNLLSNALKYSDPGAPIAISAANIPAPQRERLFILSAEDERQGGAGYLQIAVRDSGLGVPPHDLDKLFNRFVRLERDIAGSVRGTGVGLYLCRMLVEAMGGRIWVESSGVPGDGSTFIFTLPLAPAVPADPPPPLHSPHPPDRVPLASAEERGQG